MLSKASKVLMVGLSGPSSSGKTTLARLLRGVFNTRIDAPPTSIKLLILHEDDFYKTDKLIPRKTVSSVEHGARELDDWDCVESIDLPLLEQTLQHVKEHATLPPDMVSKEDQNSVGESGIPDTLLAGYHESVSQGRWLQGIVSVPTASSLDSTTTATTEVTICILDGFLLYPSLQNDSGHRSDPDETSRLNHDLSRILHNVLDLKLFLPCMRRTTVARRSRRTGYVTLEGFWEDPPGYVEDIVWPNYTQDHAWMFVDTTQESVDSGTVDVDIATKAGLEIGPGPKRRVTSQPERRDVAPRLEEEAPPDSEKTRNYLLEPDELEESGMEEVLEWGVKMVMRGIERELTKS